MSRGAKVIGCWGLACVLILFTGPRILTSQTPGRGNLLGFVYQEDGSTPVIGAVVMVKNVTSGAVFQSMKTDGLGVFKIEALGAGIYAVGVSSGQGSYNSQDFVGIMPNETAKISVSLNPYDTQSVQAAQAVAKEQTDKGESFVGRVVKYAPDAKEADVFIERGLLQTGDRVRVKGVSTDFFQDVRLLKMDGVKTKRLTTGQTGVMKSAKVCAAGDLVYVVCKRGIPPFFLAPLGIAAITGGATLTGLTEEQPVSPANPTKIKS